MNALSPRLARSGTPSSTATQNKDMNRIGSSVDDARFRRVVLPHLDDAYALARWLTGNRADAEDVVQDACLRAFRGIHNLSDGTGRAWVLTVVRHAAYDWLHKNRPLTVVLVEDFDRIEGAWSSEADAETPETALIVKADAMHLEAAIAALPALMRETLVLRNVQGLAYREIAEATGVPIGTVMSRLARARSSLCGLLAVRHG
jgi:RNA polymerase sigma factor (sigma-70 family)